MTFLKYKFMYLSCIFVMFFTLQCNQKSNHNEEPAISKDQFINLYTKSLILKYSDQCFEQMDSSLVKLFQKHNLNKETYEKTERYYKKNPKKWIEILNEVNERVKNYSENEG